MEWSLIPAQFVPHLAWFWKAVVDYSSCNSYSKVKRDNRYPEVACAEQRQAKATLYIHNCIATSEEADEVDQKLPCS